VQEGGVVTFKATENTPVTLPERAKHAGVIHAHVTWNKPLEGTERLLTALDVRVSEGKPCAPPIAEHWLLSWNAAHVLVRQSSLR